MASAPAQVPRQLEPVQRDSPGSRELCLALEARHHTFIERGKIGFYWNVLSANRDDPRIVREEPSCRYYAGVRDRDVLPKKRRAGHYRFLVGHRAVLITRVLARTRWWLRRTAEGFSTTLGAGLTQLPGLMHSRPLFKSIVCECMADN